MNTFEKDKLYVAPTYARFPVEIVGGKGALVKDSEGKEYITIYYGADITEKQAQKVAKQFQEICSDLDVRMLVLQKKRETLCGFEEPDVVLDRWEMVQKQWEACNNTRREAMRTESHYETLRAMIRPVEEPSMPDALTQ